MRKRVALAGCLRGEGPWIKATGGEATAHIGPLNSGEGVEMQIEGSEESLSCVPGVNSIRLDPGQKYRFVKRSESEVGASRTCVEVRFRCLESVPS